MIQVIAGWSEQVMLGNLHTPTNVLLILPLFLLNFKSHLCLLELPELWHIDQLLGVIELCEMIQVISLLKATLNPSHCPYYSTLPSLYQLYWRLINVHWRMIREWSPLKSLCQVQMALTIFSGISNTKRLGEILRGI